MISSLTTSTPAIRPSIGLDGMGFQFNLFNTTDQRFEDDAERNDRLQLARLLNQQSQYPVAPSVIRKAWEVLVPAILELTHHQFRDRFTLVQSLRRAKAMQHPTLKLDPAGLDQWLTDVLVLMGTLPLEFCDLPESAATGRAAALQHFDRGLEEAVSPAGRNEALMCLEMLCSRVWYSRTISSRSEVAVKVELFHALQFMYWECGVPVPLAMLWDQPPELTDPVFDGVRRHNYRQLYTLERQGELAALYERIRHGIEILAERRHAFRRRYALVQRRDSRWGRTIAEQNLMIQNKYRAADEL
ncbi:Uncharacterised protein [Achromobacter sp. 2789STDY5608633]|uniref:hypothetical protein n=1 Tax=Achromobacter sp. 2789STDY5608633 TaxID=1806501 RepID=UPI0006C52BA8|nr:hypothetical protein [Achromobacter sp. 2789STDY5608633]CUJ68864.1 Uncharacterised protein [Achromobacter sp. 2789STDY5608633]